MPRELDEVGFLDKKASFKLMVRHPIKNPYYFDHSQPIFYFILKLFVVDGSEKAEEGQTN